MKKLLLLGLVLLGGVMQVSAWDNAWLISKLNGWKYADHTQIFTSKGDGNTFYIDIDGSNIQNGDFYFRFDVDGTMGYPKVNNTLVTANYGGYDDVYTEGQNDSQPNSFKIAKNENASKVRIIVKYYEDNGYWRWHVRCKIYTNYNIGYYNDGNWTTVKAYVYETSPGDDNVAWTTPWTGVSMNQYGTTKYYTATVPVCGTSKVIFNQDSNSDQHEFSLTNNTVYNSSGSVGDQTVSIGSTGMATFCSKYPLDFTNVDDISAYAITAANNGTLSLSSALGKVPANTGLYIVGTASTNFTIPPTVEAASIGTNMLVGVIDDTGVTQMYGTNNEYTNFILTTNKGASATPKFYKVNSAGMTVTAGKAYLQIPTATVTTSSRDFFWFDNETTGIDKVDVNANDNFDANAPIYNLAGQRVSKNYKGVVIVNGKKVVIK